MSRGFPSPKANSDNVHVYNNNIVCSTTLCCVCLQMSVTDIQAEISRLKEELKEAIECGEESGKGDVRRRIVMLQLRLQQIRDTEEVWFSCTCTWGRPSN